MTDEDRIAEALRLAEQMMYDSWAVGDKSSWAPARAALEAHLRAALAPAAQEPAGWFRELPSAMSYRLWEQGGHEQEPGFVALYEGGQP